MVVEVEVEAELEVQRSYCSSTCPNVTRSVTSITLEEGAPSLVRPKRQRRRRTAGSREQKQEVAVVDRGRRGGPSSARGKPEFLALFARW